MNKKFTYKEIGPDSWYQYELSDRNIPKIMVTSDTLKTLNVVEGSDNGIKRMITDVDNIGEEITELESECFKGCPNLTSINLPITLQIIGNEAFKDCYKLSSFKDDVFNMPMYMGDSVFENCDFRKININPINDMSLENLIIGKNNFKNNQNLTNVNFLSGLILGENMFENCSSLSSINFSKDAEIIFSSNQPFQKCIKLKEIIFPLTLSNYYNIHTKTLKGSEILSIYVPGMTSDEAEYVVGKKRKVEYTYNSEVKPEEDGIIETGVLYFLNTKTGAEYINKVWESIIKKQIPCYIIYCSAGCGICQNYSSQLQRDNDFMNWLKEYNKCAVLYLDTTDSTLADRDNAPPVTAILPEPKYKFNWNNELYYMNYSSFGKQESITHNLFVNDRIMVPYNRLKIDEEYNIIDKLILNDPVGIVKSNDIFNDQYYIKSNEPKNAMAKYVKIDNDNGFPIFSYFWANGPYDVKTHAYLKLSKQEKEMFLNGMEFTIGYNSFIYTSKKVKKENVTVIKEVPATIQFTRPYGNNYGYLTNPPTGMWDDSYYYFSVNDKLIYYKIRHTQKHEENTRMNCRISNITIQNNEIYLYVSDSLWMGNGVLEPGELTSLPPSADTNVNSLKDAIIRWSNKLQMQSSVTIPPTIQESEITGDCWGVEHDCDVIDKDGKVHKYKYNPPKT